MIDMPFRRQRTFSARKNIIYGTAHLSELQSKYNQQLILTAAAYNAVNRPSTIGWTPGLMGLVWSLSKTFPYEETRGYVRLVFTQSCIL